MSAMNFYENLIFILTFSSFFYSFGIGLIFEIIIIGQMIIDVNKSESKIKFEIGNLLKRRIIYTKEQQTVFNLFKYHKLYFKRSKKRILFIVFCIIHFISFLTFFYIIFTQKI